MELLVMRDLIKDGLGNYYTVTRIQDEKITVVNAFVHFTFRRLLGEDLVKEVNNHYSKSVAVGQYFQDSLKSRISGLESGKYPGGIYTWEDVEKKYEITHEVFYERDVNV
ncbi:hypothetical protein AUC31_17575 [Planococcus rifietoensis]|uniref:Uncharacterized protein n=1 Tax=Planococcus rifietoensis TaxID=200991 RepID=A0A0U2Z3E9_9BACL|nr:hypothetical protein [Planococcus rifietoensis]ALS76919.1 hypothetical protein AUC31_17575 [Planococcus rifietoensis]